MTTVDSGVTPAIVQRLFDPNVQPSNMPPGFVVGLEDMIPLMGGHAWNPNQEPPSSLEWVNPIWIMGPYNGDITDYEPMIPLSFMVGETDNTYTEFLSYEDQTIDEIYQTGTAECCTSDNKFLVYQFDKALTKNQVKRIEQCMSSM